MVWLWSFIAVFAGVAGVRYAARLRGLRDSDGVPRVDDDAVRRILETGNLRAEDPHALDMDAASRAEEEFWRESSWDDPEEYRP